MARFCAVDPEAARRAPVGPRAWRLRQPSRHTRRALLPPEVRAREQDLEPFREARLPGAVAPDDERQPRAGDEGEAGTVGDAAKFSHGDLFEKDAFDLGSALGLDGPKGCGLAAIEESGKRFVDLRGGQNAIRRMR